MIVLLGIIAAVAAPRFLSFSEDARTSTSRGLFANFNTAVQVYRAACFARGGDTVEPVGGPYNDDFEIDGLRSSATGSCFPVREDRRDINRPNACYTIFQHMTNSDHFVDRTYSSSNPARGGENAENIPLSGFEQARDAGYQVFIQQRRRYFSYCHFYSLEGDLSEAAYVLYNAIDGSVVTGTADLTQGISWSDELEKYAQQSNPPFN